MPENEQARLGELVARAKAASANAYCPYSGFKVGAAVLTSDGAVYTGCNVENASYGLAVCAERNALFQMVAAAKRKVEMVVLYTPTPEPTAPCGACRQVISEFGPNAHVVCACDGPDQIRTNVEGLLPRAFGPRSLRGGG